MIRIDINGPAKCGKTHLAAKIENLVRAEGLEAFIVDGGYHEDSIKEILATYPFPPEDPVPFSQVTVHSENKPGYDQAKEDWEKLNKWQSQEFIEDYKRFLTEVLPYKLKEPSEDMAIALLEVCEALTNMGPSKVSRICKAANVLLGEES